MTQRRLRLSLFFSLYYQLLFRKESLFLYLLFTLLYFTLSTTDDHCGLTISPLHIEIDQHYSFSLSLSNIDIIFPSICRVLSALPRKAQKGCPTADLSGHPCEIPGEPRALPCRLPQTLCQATPFLHHRQDQLLDAEHQRGSGHSKPFTAEISLAALTPPGVADLVRHGLQLPL